MTESVSNSSTAYCSPPSTQPRFYNHHDPSTFDDSNNSDLINNKSNGLDFQNFSDGSIKDIIDIIDNSQYGGESPSDNNKINTLELPNEFQHKINAASM